MQGVFHRFVLSKLQLGDFGKPPLRVAEDIIHPYNEAGGQVSRAEYLTVDLFL